MLEANENSEIRIFRVIEVIEKPKVDIFLSDGQYCIFCRKLVRDIDLILFASESVMTGS